MTTLRVVKGTPDDDELAAIVAALLVVAGRRPEKPRPARPAGWRAALPPGPPPRGPGAWRAAARAT
jgi:hypothetical protein